MTNGWGFNGNSLLLIAMILMLAFNAGVNAYHSKRMRILLGRIADALTPNNTVIVPISNHDRKIIRDKLEIAKRDVT